MGTQRQVAQFEWPNGNPLERPDFVVDAGQHSPDFAIAAFGQHNFQPAPPRSPFELLGFGRPGQSLSDINALFEFSKFFGRRHTRNLDVVFFLNAVPRMCQVVCQIPIVGNQD